MFFQPLWDIILLFGSIHPFQVQWRSQQELYLYAVLFFHQNMDYCQGFVHQQTNLCSSISNKKSEKEGSENRENETEYPHSKENSTIHCYFKKAFGIIEEEEYNQMKDDFS